MVDSHDLGPVDYVVVELPAGTRDFGGELARELVSLVDAEMIRMLDMLIIEKDDRGRLSTFEMGDLGDRQRLRMIEDGLTELLALDDIDRLAAALAPGSVAGVLIWENVWATPFTSAARSGGGDLVATGRIPARTVVHALRAPSVDPPSDATRRTGRVARCSVIEHSVS